MIVAEHESLSDDPEYIVRLVGQVIRVSVETVKIVSALPKSYGGPL
jgi:predicted helicase